MQNSKNGMAKPSKPKEGNINPISGRLASSRSGR
jgi:hypothetical protein